MPFITIITREEDRPLDLKKTAAEISADTGIALERLNLMVESYSSANYYRGSGNRCPIIQVAARLQNGTELIQALMTAASKAIARQLNIDEANIIVYAHPIEDFLFLADGKIV